MRFSKAIDSYDKEAHVQRQIAFRMTVLLNTYLKAPCRQLLEVGCGTGIYSRMLLSLLRPEKAVFNDICPEMENYLADILTEEIVFHHGDAENSSFRDGQDLITSCSTLQWFAEPGLFFGRCHNMLNKEGYLAFSTFGPGNMHEISSLTGTSLYYHSKKMLEEMLSPDFEIIYSEEEIITLNFATPLRVLYHLKHTGVTAVKKEVWTKKNLSDFCHSYAEKYQHGQSVPLTYHPIYLIAKKKEHEEEYLFCKRY